MGLKKTQSATNSVDIQFDSIDRDVVVIRGTPEEAASVRLTGSVILNAAENISIKRVHVKLFGTLRLKWNDLVTTPRGQSVRPIRYDKILFDQEFTDVEARNAASSSGANSANSSPASSNRTTPVGSRSASFTNLASLSGGSANHNRSSSALTGLTAMPSSSNIQGASSPPSNGGLGSGVGSSSSLSLSTLNASTRVFNKGVHTLPFEIVIPGDIPESIEGLSGATVVYRVFVTVERGRFSNNLMARKHLRIVRTIGADAFELNQTISIENIWPNKVQYCIETPSKAMAIGSSVPVHFLLIPLLKGLKPGKIKVQVYEYVNLTSPLGHTYSRESLAYEETLPPPADDELTVDRWEFTKRFRLPTSLSKCTQDCEIDQYVKVTHKLKFALSLINPDKHVSELRASLPVYLYISPHVKVQSIDASITQIPGRTPEEHELFSSTTVDDNEVLATSTQSSTYQAPPNYEHHIYDRLWSEVPTPQLESPTHSGQSSPGIASRRGSIDGGHSGTGMTPLDPTVRSQLTAGLRALELQQRTQLSSSSGTPCAVNGQAAGSDYFSRALANGVSTPSSPVTAASPGGGSDIDMEMLSRVPSYSTAAKIDPNTQSAVVDPAPEYDYSSMPSSPSFGPSSRPPPHVLTPGIHNSQTASRSAPGSAHNLGSLNATLASVANGNTNAKGHSSVPRPSTPTESPKRGHSNVASISSILHRNVSSKSLFEGFRRKHH
uniref:ARAD1D09174p n=1 Tax=Blastobotrys adeninivorans TaxID=409370 RepID=A0A060T965_BLAAD